MAKSVLQIYQYLIDDGHLRRDSEQIHLAKLLDELKIKLENGQNIQKSNGLLGRFNKRKDNKKPVKGLYIWGGVGRGKTLIMDLFFEHVAIKRKWRRHFHAFMQDVHNRIHVFRMSQKAGTIPDDHDPISDIADQIAKETELLCFDEFQVSDITDAMILGRLFEALFERGIVVVTTSNLAPDDLYKDGLNRHAFLPSIKIIKQNVDIVEIDNGEDYRMQMAVGAEHYYCPLGPGSDAKVEWLWRQLTGRDQGHEVEIPVKGRKLMVPQAVRQSARFHFNDLCVKALGSADYLALAKQFNIIFIEQIPLLDDSLRNEAKRFILLIDTFYDQNIKVVLSAAAPPEQLQTGSNNAIEFTRTASRLTEMQSKDYWQFGVGA